MTARTRTQGTKGTKEPLPAFTTKEEEAAFWDTHSLADYWPEFTPAQARFAQPLSRPLSIRFDPETLAQLRARAKELGIGPTTLVRMWILERLRASKQDSANGASP